MRRRSASFFSSAGLVKEEVVVVVNWWCRVWPFRGGEDEVVGGNGGGRLPNP
jgi:hypothetical protein